MLLYMADNSNVEASCVAADPIVNVGNKTSNFSTNQVSITYATKLSLSVNVGKANFQKFETSVPDNTDYDFELPIVSVHAVNDRSNNSLYIYFIGKILAFLGADPILRYGSWMKVKFHDVSLVAYTSDGLRLMAVKIGFPMMLDSYTNNMCLDSWGRSSYAISLIEINACNEFKDNLVMVVPKLEGRGYTKETSY
ncbi:hypothetical protein Tco_0758043 [Tanacetum coccineum]